MEQKQERLLSMWCHLGVVIGNAGIVVPLLIWLLKKNESELVNENGKKSLNFWISMYIYITAAYLLCFLLIGIPILIGLAIFGLVMIIRASMKSYRGEEFNYPLSIKFIK